MLLPLLLVITVTSGAAHVPHFVSSYYKHKNVSLLSTFTCDLQFNVKMLKHLSQEGIRVNMLSSPVYMRFLHEHDHYHKTGVLLDVSCPRTADVLKEASRRRLFDTLHSWLLFAGDALTVTHNATTPTDIIQEHLLQDLSILTDSDVVWALPHKANLSQIFLMDIYKATDYHPLNMTLTAIAQQNPDNTGYEIRVLVKELPSRRRKNLHGYLMKAITVILYPDQFNGMEDMYNVRKRHIDTWSKINFPVHEYLGYDLNFTMEVVIVDNYGWQQNGSFDGMMGMLQRGEVDMLAAAIFMRKDRMLVVDYAAETTKLQPIAIFRQPSLSSVSNIFLLPFNRTVWLCCGLTCLLVMVILTLQVIITTKQHIENELLRTTWADVVTLVLAANCQQGYHLSPQTLSSRITVFIIFLASLFFFTSYSANIVALLQTPSTAIKTVADLTGSPLTVQFQDVLYNRVYLTESTDPVIRELYDRKVSRQGERAYVKNVSNGIQRIRNGMFAFHVDANMGYKEISATYTEREKCSLAQLEVFPLPLLATAVPKKSHLREMYAVRVRWQREVGILKHLENIWLEKKYNCENKMSGYVTVGLVDFYPALLALQYGMVAAVGFFVMELFWNHRNKILQNVLCRNVREKYSDIAGNIHPYKN